MSNEVFPSNFRLDELLKFVTIPDFLRTRIKELQYECDRLIAIEDQVESLQDEISDLEDDLNRVEYDFEVLERQMTNVERLCGEYPGDLASEILNVIN